MTNTYTIEKDGHVLRLKLACKDRMDSIISSPLCKSFIAGSVSGTCSTILFQPLDLLKTKLQAPITVGHHGNSGIIQTFIRVLRNEKFLGLWRGVVPSITRCVPGVGMYFCTLSWLKTTTGFTDPTPLQAVSLGACSRFIAGISLIPVTVVKTRFESGRFNYKGVFQALKVIYTMEGRRGLFSGTTATLMRDIPFSGLYLMFYIQTKKYVSSEEYSNRAIPVVHFGCGIIAGVLASGFTQPADVIKTHMQLYPNKYNGVFHVVKAIIQMHGPYGFLRGMLPRCLRRTLMAAMAWTVYEQAMKKFGLK